MLRCLRISDLLLWSRSASGLYLCKVGRPSGQGAGPVLQAGPGDVLVCPGTNHILLPVLLSVLLLLPLNNNCYTSVRRNESCRVLMVLRRPAGSCRVLQSPEISVTA